MRFMQSSSGRRRGRRFLSAACAAVAALPASGWCLEVVGTRDAFDFPAAESLAGALSGGVVLGGGNGNPRFESSGQSVGAYSPCSGTAITSSSILTAGHCIAPSAHQKTVNGFVVNFSSGLQADYVVAQGRGDSLLATTGSTADGTLRTQLGGGATGGGAVLAYITHNPHVGEPDWAVAAVATSRGGLVPTVARLDPGLPTLAYAAPKELGYTGTYEAYFMGGSNPLVLSTGDYTRMDTRAGTLLVEQGSQAGIIRSVWGKTAALANTPLHLDPADPNSATYLLARYSTLAVRPQSGDSGGGLFSVDRDSSQLLLRGVLSQGGADGVSSEYVSVADNYRQIARALETMKLYAGLTPEMAGSLPYLPKFADREDVVRSLLLETFTSSFEIAPDAEGLTWLAQRSDGSDELALGGGRLIAGLSFDESVLPLGGFEVFARNGQTGELEALALHEEDGVLLFDRAVDNISFRNFINLDLTGTLTLGVYLVQVEDDEDEEDEEGEQGAGSWSGLARAAAAPAARGLAGAAADSALVWTGVRHVGTVPQAPGWELATAGLLLLAVRRRMRCKP